VNSFCHSGEGGNPITAVIPRLDRGIQEEKKDPRQAHSGMTKKVVIPDLIGNPGKKQYWIARSVPGNDKGCS